MVSAMTWALSWCDRAVGLYQTPQVTDVQPQLKSASSSGVAVSLLGLCQAPCGGGGSFGGPLIPEPSGGTALPGVWWASVSLREGR